MRLALPRVLKNGAKRLFGAGDPNGSNGLAPVTSDHIWGAFDVLEGAPPLALYENAVMLPQYWALFDEGGDLIMPSAFCRTSEPQIIGALNHVAIDRKELQIVEEELIYGGTLHPHFGHQLCTGLSRAWAFQRHPDLRIVIHRNEHMLFPATLGTGLGAFCFQKLGVHGDRAIQPEKPTLFRRIWIPSSAFDEQWRGYDAFRQMCLSLGEGCSERNGGPIYLSKTKLKVTPHAGLNRVINEIEIEDHLAKRKVEIVYPEQLSIEKQIGLFASNRTILGLTGSALHMHIFAPANGRIIGLQATTPMISNQWIIDGLARRKANYFLPIEPSVEMDSNIDGFIRTVKIENPQSVAKSLLKLI